MALNDVADLLGHKSTWMLEAHYRPRRREMTRASMTGDDLMGTGVGPRALVGQSAQAAVGIADQPAVQGPSFDAMASGHVAYGRPVSRTSRTAR
jgi:hypothetical protein